jgi:hypothetical protein
MKNPSTIAAKGKTMRNQLLSLTIALGAVFGTSAWAADAMTKDAYKAAKNTIEETAKAEKKACDVMKDNAKDVCQSEAKAKEKIAKAELDAQNKPGPKADEKVRLMKAEGAYEIAKEKCEDQKGKEMAACKKDAKLAHDKAKAEAKMAGGKGDAKKS